MLSMCLMYMCVCVCVCVKCKGGRNVHLSKQEKLQDLHNRFIHLYPKGLGSIYVLAGITDVTEIRRLLRLYVNLAKMYTEVRHQNYVIDHFIHKIVI